MNVDVSAQLKAPPHPQEALEKPVSAYVAMAQPRLVGLTGKARSGKDTVASMLRNNNEGVATISFAEPIRNALRGMMGLDDEHFHGLLKEVSLGWIDASPRMLMQTLGTQWGRELVDDQLWIKLAQRDIRRYLRLGISVVVTDVRFENEATLLRSMGGVVWHIIRNDVAAVNSHASEAGIAVDNSDMLISNNGTLEFLETQASRLWTLSERFSHE